MSFVGKVALVTGGGSGMGAATCRALAREGADIAIFDLSLENGEKVCSEVRNLGRKAFAQKVDVGSFQEVQAAVQKTYDEFSHIDFLVNAAGYGRYVLLKDMSEEIWDRCIAVHLKGTFNTCRAVVNGMIAQKFGKIVNISSTTGISGSPMHSNYAAAKAGVIGFTKALAKEVARDGVNVNAIAPGITDTPFLDAAKKQSPEVLQKIVDSIPKGRLGTAEEIAAVVLFLCSEASAYVVGQVISPNGGFLT